MVCVRRDIPLSALTTLGVGGKCRLLFDLLDRSSFIRAFDLAARKGLRLIALGGGSNVVVADRPKAFAALRFHDATFKVHIIDGENVLVRAGAGARLDDLVSFCVSEGFAGLECLSGIPGTVGGAVVQNAGAYGSEIGSVVDNVETVNLLTGEVKVFRKKDCGFSYRRSFFKNGPLKSYMVSRVSFLLKRKRQNLVEHSEIRLKLGLEAALEEIRKCVLELRRRKGMILEPQKPFVRSVGCFFKNPVISEAGLRRLECELKEDLSGHAFPEKEGAFKVSAGFLVEKAGFNRGYSEGKVALSENHALCLVNLGEGTAEEVLKLAGKIQDEVFCRFGVLLEPEPVFIGFEKERFPLRGAVVVP